VGRAREQFERDGSDKRGPRTSESRRANGSSALTGGSHCAEREWDAREGNWHRHLGPTGQRERERERVRERARAKETTPTGGARLTEPSWAVLGQDGFFPFSSEFLIIFLFIFSRDANQIKPQFKFKLLVP
jgi:hypothetical protein